MSRLWAAADGDGQRRLAIEAGMTSISPVLTFNERDFTRFAGANSQRIVIPGDASPAL
jgi:hypothetical protein